MGGNIASLGLNMNVIKWSVEDVDFLSRWTQYTILEYASLGQLPVLLFFPNLVVKIIVVIVQEVPASLKIL